MISAIRVARDLVALTKPRITLMAVMVAAAAGAAALAGRSEVRAAAPFKLKYAPHFGMFKNHAPGGLLDELKFMRDQDNFEDQSYRAKRTARARQQAADRRRDTRL